LSRALHPADVQAAFAKLTGDADIIIESIQLIRHKPGRRAVIEYRVRTNGTVWTLIGKARAKGLDQKAFDVTKRLSVEFTKLEPSAVCIPRPYNVLPEFNMWLQEKVAGGSATKLLLTDAALTLAPRIAKAAHAIHGSAAAPSRTHTISDEMQILAERLSAVSAAKPEWRERLRNVLSDCHSLAPSVAEAKACPIHRDFHPGQVLVDGARLWLLDFDLFSLGDPAVDVGNFIAHVTELSLRHFGNESRLSSVERAIEEAYVALAGEEIRRRIQVYALLTLARHIYISTQFEERRAFTEAILSSCERRLSATES
jgi:streptomycin 6-kinase